jgi:hypothetical protein
MPFHDPFHPRSSFVKARHLITVALVLLAACAGEDDGGTGPGNGGGAPAAPTNVVVQAQSSTTAQVTWQTVANATNYEIERAPGTSGGTFTRVGQATAAPFNDSGLEPNTAYRYRVRGLNGTTAGAYSAEVATTTLQPGRQVVNVTQDITTNTTWVADNVYRLQGFRKVAAGATLTIQPGTRIEGDFNTLGSSLFVLRGARIVAVGTQNNPIVFTSSRQEGTRQPGDWGGLIIIGNARINRGSPTTLEGTGTSSDNALINYAGGTDDADNSGELRYVRVEFAGFGPAADAELNSFTFAAVGSGTQLNYLQVLAGLDDSYEWFGGTVDGKYLVSYESGDDHFDMAEGYSGRLQYLIAFQSRLLQPRDGAGNVSNDQQGIENDGCAGASCTNGQDSQPFTVPLVSNFTLVGAPSTVTLGTAGARGAVLRRGTGGYYYNGIIARWTAAGLSVRDASTGARAAAGLLEVKNHLLAETPLIFDASTNAIGDTSAFRAANAIVRDGAATLATIFTAVPAGQTTAQTTEADFDWSLTPSSPARTGGLATFTGNAATKGGSVVTGTAFRGAHDPAAPKWWVGWTNYAFN